MFQLIWERVNKFHLKQEIGKKFTELLLKSLLHISVTKCGISLLNFIRNTVCGGVGDLYAVDILLRCALCQSA